MLTNLFVSDLALIRRLSVDFSSGFSVLTGQTGAGKSLILDALSLFLQQKAEKSLVREGAPYLEVSLFFDELCPETKEELAPFFSSEELEEGITLTRRVTSAGKSSCKIGERTVPFSRLYQVSSALLSIQGQNAAGGLLEEKNHRAYLDSALSATGKEILAEYVLAYREYTEEKNAIEKMKETLSQGVEKADLWEYQMKEIARVKPKRGEDEALEEKLRSLQQMEKVHGALHTADRAISGGERGKGALFLLEAAASRMALLGEEDEQFSFSEELYDLARRVKEIGSEISYRLSGVSEEDPRDLADRIRKRLDALYQLKLKYGSTVDEVISYYEEIKEKKDLTVTLKDDIKRAAKNLLSLEKKVQDRALALRKERERAAKELSEGVHSVLSFLDMPNTRFSVMLDPCDPTFWGTETVSFAIAANKGEGTKPLALVASGGESSRIMLALQLKLGNAKDADTLVFDEVDTGISGATAQKIGIALKTLSQKRQVFCVTHSAQVSTLADEHFLVKKEEKEGRTETFVSLLDEEGSLDENARLFAGAVMTDKAKAAAQDLRQRGLAEYEKWKDTVL